MTPCAVEGLGEFLEETGSFETGLFGLQINQFTAKLVNHSDCRESKRDTFIRLPMPAARLNLEHKELCFVS